MKRDQEYLIGLDLGTSAVKGVLMSAGGEVVSREKAQTEYRESNNGFVEFDVEQFYMLTTGVIRRLVSSLPKGASVSGISMASASGNTLLVDKAGIPMIPVISWMDTRVNDEIENVFGELKAQDVSELTGWPLIKMFPMAHLSWLRCHEPALLEKAYKVCMSTEYVNYRLTGEWGIDSSTATTFYLQDQKAASWHIPYLRKIGIPEWKLPIIHASGTVLGYVQSAAASDTGLLPGTPVVLGSFDHPCAARGAGVFEEGQMLISCGTSWVGFYPVKDRRKALGQKMFTDPFLYPGGAWGAMFSLPAIAAGVDKYICRYISDAPDRYREFDRLSASSRPGAGGLVINPMQNDDSDKPGQYTKPDIARAIMEGAAYLLKSRIDELERGGIHTSAVTMVGGPSETHPWPQIVCDVLGLELSVINGSCAGAVGAAVLAGIGAGLYDGIRDAFSKLAFTRTILTPDTTAHKIYKELCHC